MTRGVRKSVVGSVVLAALITAAGCSHYMLAEREPWRREAELTCLNSGVVEATPGRVRIASIDGPGACGISYPLKVSELGESAPLSYTDDALRPPSSIPAGAMPQQWPIVQSSTLPPPNAPPPPDATPVYRPQPYGAQPYNGQPYGGQPYGAQTYGAQPQPYGQPYRPQPYGQPQYGAAPYGVPPPAIPQAGVPMSLSPPGIAPAIEGELDRPNGPAPYDGALTAPVANAPPPVYSPRPMAPPPGGEIPPLGPPAAPAATAGPVQVKPAATLACPLVSMLDKWISTSVQPAALKWFRQPVVEIKQISAYSCRGMNGNPNAHISEHAFGNALDVAEFDLADGHKVSVQYGWHGTPEEQGFLHDVQDAACDDFTTVLAPGANVYHYNHIHVDLMRHASSRHICEPAAIPGDVAAARARAHYAAEHGYRGITGSIKPRRHDQQPLGYSGDEDRLPLAVPGED